MITDQDKEYLRHLYAMFVLNGLLSRLNPDEVHTDKVWQFVDEIIETSEPKQAGIASIKRKKKNETNTI